MPQTNTLKSVGYTDTARYIGDPDVIEHAALPRPCADNGKVH